MSGPIRTAFENQTMRGLQGALAGLSRRQGLIANNIANVDTPGFIASDVSFEGALKQAMGGEANGLEMTVTSPLHFGGAQGSQSASGSNGLGDVVSTGNTALRNDGNNVDVDREMARLAETGIRYQAVASQVAARYSLLRNIVSEGRR